jgi:hypothetical protein
MYRDEQVAALERLARLEERVRELDPQQKKPFSKRAKAGIVGGLVLALAGAGFAVFYLGSVAGQTVMRSSAGHMVSVRFGTDVDDVHWFDASGHPREALVMTNYLPQPNQASRVTTLIVPDDQVSRTGPTSFLVTYRAFGIPRKATVSFQAETTDVDFVRNVLTGLPASSWVAFSKDEAPLLYFSTLLAYKYALTSITWGLDDGPLDRTVQFAPSSKLGIDPTDQIYVRLPVETRLVRVKLRYKDGRESEIRTVTRDAATLR